MKLEKRISGYVDMFNKGGEDREEALRLIRKVGFSFMVSKVRGVAVGAVNNQYRHLRSHIDSIKIVS